MSKNFGFVPSEVVEYYGVSDFLGQIADELRNNPTGCFATNVLAWYNDEYSSLSGVSGCEYQKNINKTLCPTQTPNSITDLAGIVLTYTTGMDRRRARVVINILHRELLRANTANLGARIP